MKTSFKNGIRGTIRGGFAAPNLNNWIICTSEAIMEGGSST